jgi:uncharacterized protein (TIGR03083 family)
VNSTAYAGARERIIALLHDQPDEFAPVQTCPGWLLRDVVSHLAGGVDDALAGRLDGLATEEWTAAQVSKRRDTPLAQIIFEWVANATRFEPLLDVAGELGTMAVADIASHEHDIRGALAAPGARDSDAVRIGLGWVARQLIGSASERGVALRVQSVDGLDLGPHDADATLIGDDFELLRAMTGRRSVEQLREMKWEGDMERALPAFTWFVLKPAETRIVE